MSRWTSAGWDSSGALGLVLLLAVGSGACATGDRSDDEQPASDAFTVVHEWTTQTVHREDSLAGNALLAAVNVTEHPGFDRITFTFRDGPLPGYAVEIASRPIQQCGSGKPVELAGSTALEVRFVGAQAHTEGGQPSIENRALVVRQPVMREAVLICDFEGYVTWGLGLEGPASYRMLQDTTAGRIAIDVRR